MRPLWYKQAWTRLWSEANPSELLILERLAIRSGLMWRCYAVVKHDGIVLDGIEIPNCTECGTLNITVEDLNCTVCGGEFRWVPR